MRDAVVNRWHRELEEARWSDVPADVAGTLLGRAFELCIGLDLGEQPAYWHLLAFLPAPRCGELLHAAGFSSSDAEHPEVRTDDPLLRRRRHARPVEADAGEEAALEAVLDAASWDNVAHSSDTC